MPSFTRKAIMQSCSRLLEERPVDKITVKDIVDDCQINRNTFYYHFNDLPSLITEILKEDTEKIIRETRNAHSLWEYLESAVQYALDHRRAVLHIFRSSNRIVFEQHLFLICQQTADRYVEELCSDMPVKEDDKRIIIQAYKCECFGQIMNWLSCDMKEDIARDMIRLCRLREGETKTLFLRSMEM